MISDSFDVSDSMHANPKQEFLGMTYQTTRKGKTEERLLAADNIHDRWIFCIFKIIQSSSRRIISVQLRIFRIPSPESSFKKFVKNIARRHRLQRLNNPPKPSADGIVCSSIHINPSLSFPTIRFVDVVLIDIACKAPQGKEHSYYFHTAHLVVKDYHRGNGSDRQGDGAYDV